MMDQLAQNDQVCATLRNQWAKRMAEYWKGLMDEGFERREALDLTVSYQETVLLEQRDDADAA